jgi:hypothetical protein
MKIGAKPKLFTDDPAVRYLLKLPGCDREEIESRLFSEDRLSEVLESAERELLDRYVRRQLPAALHERVETELLFDERQRDKLRVAEMLAARTPRIRIGLWAAVGIAAAIVLAAGLTYVTISSQAGHRQLEARPITQMPAGRTPRIFTILLTPGMARGSDIVSVRLPPKADLIRLELADVDSQRTYSAWLAESSGAALWRSDQLRPDNSGVTVTIPATLLHPGEFRLTLSGEPPRIYHFRVR